jgi:hypothetical protein
MMSKYGMRVGGIMKNEDSINVRHLPNKNEMGGSALPHFSQANEMGRSGSLSKNQQLTSSELFVSH